MGISLNDKVMEIPVDDITAACPVAAPKPVVPLSESDKKRLANE